MELMTPSHPAWTVFLASLEGPNGCNFRDAGDGTVNWDCDNSIERPKARRILAMMGFSKNEIEDSLSFYEEHGGYCDCEIAFNVGGYIE